MDLATTATSNAVAAAVAAAMMTRALLRRPWEEVPEVVVQEGMEALAAALEGQVAPEKALDPGVGKGAWQLKTRNLRSVWGWGCLDGPPDEA